MSRFYVPPECIGENEIIVSGNEAHHILDVMRMIKGDSVVIFDGKGNEYSGYIKDCENNDRRLIISIQNVSSNTSSQTSKIILVQAIPKNNKIDYIVEKATELGVSSIIPVISARTIVHPEGDSRTKKVSRWRKIALESAKQCGRRDIPEINDIMLFKNVASIINQYDLVLFASLSDENISIKEALKGFKSGSVMVFIGPEGDFTSEEKSMMHHNNLKFVSFGKNILRSDTAGLFALSIISYELFL